MTLLGDEKCRSKWCRERAISDSDVLFQSLHRGSMNRHITRFSKLCSSDVKDPSLEINMHSVQTESLVHPHSGRYQQSEKSGIGAGTQSVGRGELLRCEKELFNLCVAVHVRGLASVTMWEKSCGKNFGARFGGAMPDGEASYDA